MVQKASSEQINKIKESGLKGIYINKQKLRFYPFGSLASHVLGFVSPTVDKEFSGRYGVELQYNSLLAGAPGETDGKDIILTIDKNVQAQAEEVFKKWRRNGRPKAARLLFKNRQAAGF